MRTKKSHKEKGNNSKTKERLASAKEEDGTQNQELEQAIEEIKHLPQDEFNKAFEKFLVRVMEEIIKKCSFYLCVCFIS